MTKNPLGILTIESDADFEVIFREQCYYDFVPRSFCITPAELSDFKFIGHPDKLFEVQEGMRAILKDPDKYFSNSGGNRSITWEPNAKSIYQTVCETIQDRRWILSIKSTLQ